MDPEEARRCVDAGGTLLCMGVPAGTEMTFDLSSLVIGHKFRGIKMIPPGLHLLCWDAGRDRHATFLNFECSGVVVWRWSEEMEDLMLLEHGEEQERLVHAVRSYAFDGELGMCPTENQITWPRVANLITPATLQRCSIPAHKKTSAGAQDGSEVFDEAPVRPAFGFRDGPGQQRRTRGMNADEVSEYNLDGSERVEALLGSRFGGEWNEMLAEMQVAFLLFLLLASLDALEAWKGAVSLLASSGRLMAQRPAGMAEFVRVLRRQLEHVPEDFFRDELSSANFLGPALANLVEEATAAVKATRATGAAPRAADAELLSRRVGRLTAVLGQRFGCTLFQSWGTSACDAACF